MKRCTVGIRRPEDQPPPATSRDQPSVWFPSMATMAAVLSEDNRALLRLEPISELLEQKNYRRNLHKPEEILGMELPTVQQSTLVLHPREEPLHNPAPLVPT